MDAQDDPLEVLWKRVLEDWDNASSHEAFLQTAFDREDLGRAAALYRTQLADEGREQLARKKLGAVAMLATQVMESSKSEPSSKAPRWLLIVAALLCAAGVAVLAWAFSA